MEQENNKSPQKTCVQNDMKGCSCSPTNVLALSLTPKTSPQRNIMPGVYSWRIILYERTDKKRALVLILMPRAVSLYQLRCHLYIHCYYARSPTHITRIFLLIAFCALTILLLLLVS